MGEHRIARDNPHRITRAVVFTPDGSRLEFEEDRVIGFSHAGGQSLLQVKGTEPEQVISYCGMPFIVTMEPRRVAVPTGVQLVE